MKPQFLISSTTSDSGKTLFTMGLICALKKRGLKVQPYKCGTDFIDAQWLSVAADSDTVHLDPWLSSHTHVQFLYNKYGEKADICLTEGAVGLCDGYKKMQGSSAEVAGMLNIPVVLLVNARGLGYSVAPMIYGFKHFNPSMRLAGVIFNQVASVAHYACLREACADAGVDSLGYLPASDDLKLPSKHVGMTSTIKQSLDALVARSAELIEKYVDIDRLINRCNQNFPCQYTLPYSSDIVGDSFPNLLSRLKIAVARDPAFNFIFKENLSQLEKIGDITYFSPVFSNNLPAADLVYIPGGYPELFARQLHRRHSLMESLKEYAEKGGKILAECGGMVYLGKSLTGKQGGTAYEMCNILPIDSELPIARPVSGYRQFKIGTDFEIKGSEFHYYQLSSCNLQMPGCKIVNGKGVEVQLPFYRYKNVIATSANLYWGEKNILDLWNL